MFGIVVFCRQVITVHKYQTKLSMIRKMGIPISVLEANFEANQIFGLTGFEISYFESEIARPNLFSIIVLPT